MDVWIGVLAFVLFLGFAIAVYSCVNAIKRNPGIIIKSRLHQSFGCREVIYANLGLVAVVILLIFKLYIFVPGALMFVLFVVLSTSVKSGLTEEGALVGTDFLEWEQMDSYKLVNDASDSNIIILKIRANHKQYVLVCNREDRYEISELMRGKKVKTTEVNMSANDTWKDTSNVEVEPDVEAELDAENEPGVEELGTEEPDVKDDKNKE